MQSVWRDEILPISFQIKDALPTDALYFKIFEFFSISNFFVVPLYVQCDKIFCTYLRHCHCLAFDFRFVCWPMKRKEPARTSGAERARQARLRARQEIEMLENEIVTLKAKVANLESIIRKSIEECTCDAKDATGKRVQHKSKNAIPNIENENNRK